MVNMYTTPVPRIKKITTEHASDALAARYVFMCH